MSFFLNAATVLSSYYAVELGLRTADGLIELDFRGIVLTGSLPASLSSLPIVVRALRICLSHFSLSVYATCAVCSCNLLLLLEVI